MLLGAETITIGLATTPTLEMAIIGMQADGGIMISASHNPIEWNALKLFNEKGEFLTPTQGELLLKIVKEKDFSPAASVQALGKKHSTDYTIEHIQAILQLPLVQRKEIKDKKIKVVVDPVNSVGALAVKTLLRMLGVEAEFIHDQIDGKFAHNPEPLPEHLKDLSDAVKRYGADLGIAVDPDVDRLVLVDENGNFFGEEYTLVAVADYILHFEKGALVSNLSSSLALSDLAKKHDVPYYASPVGEVHVVEKMKQVKAIIGGEGNGGVIYPPLHYGRDALVGIALILSLLAHTQMPLSEIKNRYQNYYMYKAKKNLSTDFDPILTKKQLLALFPGAQIDTQDGVKAILQQAWIHVRASNTEPIVRIYTEATTIEEAEKIAQQFIDYKE